MSDVDHLRIVVIAPLRYPIRQPHAGGLESAVWNEVRLLLDRGHDVRLVAVEGSDFLAGGPPEFILPAVRWTDGVIESDVDYPPGYLLDAVGALDRALSAIGDSADVILNHCLHPLPLRRAHALGVPMVTTLHTPVLDEMVAANARGGAWGGSDFLAVSSHTAGLWATAGIDALVVPNGVDITSWPLGDGGDDLVWFGRIVPEKGVHHAIRAARLVGRRLMIAGRIGDARYADEHLIPELGDDVVYLGALGQHELATLVGRSACALITPVWEEPFGLVVPESLLCGTPVAAFGVGGLRESVRRATGAIAVAPGDVDALAEAAAGVIDEVRRRRPSRSAIRAAAVRRFSLEARLDTIEQVLIDVILQAESRESA